VTSDSTTPVIITDTSVLINLCHTGHILLLGGTTGFQFVVSDEVIAELTEPDQRRKLDEALAAGALGKESISSPAELATFASLTQTLGIGESACLALAANRNWFVACDEKGLFLREALRRLGDGRILNTAGLYVLWIRRGVLTIRRGVLTVADADRAKGVLEGRRFKLAFDSFGDVI
jgi:predicted nucleic acid-binding protein